jgi:hypothetical protein
VILQRVTAQTVGIEPTAPDDDGLLVVESIPRAQVPLLAHRQQVCRTAVTSIRAARGQSPFPPAAFGTGSAPNDSIACRRDLNATPTDGPWSGAETLLREVSTQARARSIRRACDTGGQCSIGPRLLPTHNAKASTLT